MGQFKVISQGHKYDLLNLEDPIRSRPQRLLFINKKKVGDDLVTVHNGTTNEAVIGMLIDRIGYLNEKMESKHNVKAISHLKGALNELQARTRKREKAGVEGTAKELPENETYSVSDDIPEDMPYSGYLSKNGLETIGDVDKALAHFEELKYIGRDRAETIAEWIVDNV